jgi:hypothetical protein
MREVEGEICKSVIKSGRLSAKLPISPCSLDQHHVVQIRVCTVYTEDEFALDPLPR